MTWQELKWQRWQMKSFVFYLKLWSVLSGQNYPTSETSNKIMKKCITTHTLEKVYTYSCSTNFIIICLWHVLACVMSI